MRNARRKVRSPSRKAGIADESINQSFHKWKSFPRKSSDRKKVIDDILAELRERQVADVDDWGARRIGLHLSRYGETLQRKLADFRRFFPQAQAQPQPQWEPPRQSEPQQPVVDRTVKEEDELPPALPFEVATEDDYDWWVIEPQDCGEFFAPPQPQSEPQSEPQPVVDRTVKEEHELPPASPFNYDWWMMIDLLGIPQDDKFLFD
jgi:hypothetical protein